MMFFIITNKGLTKNMVVYHNFVDWGWKSWILDGKEEKYGVDLSF